MKEQCVRCKKLKRRSDFYTRRDNGRSSYCKACQNQISQEHYRNNKANYVANNKRRKSIRRQEMRALKNAPCADCGILYPPYVMDYDHRPGTKKLFNLGGAAGIVSMKRYQAEIKKCDLVCANCHRERTHNRKK